MRKRIITPTPTIVTPLEEGWLDIEHAATVEVASEENNFPMRLIFDEPQELKRLSVVFEEHEMTRTQEFVLRASSNRGGSFREIVRNNGISARLQRCVRWRITVSSFRISSCWN